MTYNLELREYKISRKTKKEKLLVNPVSLFNEPLKKRVKKHAMS
jgi:hypothetical protein